MVSVILLSATLPMETRARLTTAFRRGLGIQDPQGALPDERAYPLASVCSQEASSSSPVPGAPGRARSVPVRFLRDPGKGVAQMLEAAEAGQAVLYIRNTVDDALGGIQRDCRPPWPGENDAVPFPICAGRPSGDRIEGDCDIRQTERTGRACRTNPGSDAGRGGSRSISISTRWYRISHRLTC